MVFEKASDTFKFTIYIFFKSQHIPSELQKNILLLALIFNL